MSRIQQLDPHVINRIAAGEVVERPASVVKELLENSVDALATRVEVDIAAGGIDLVRISDNGEGMHPDDLLLSVTSHATSKICSDQDLTKVSTLGFRGEALASIASISRFRIRTRRRGLDTGRELHAEGGEVGVLHECGCPEGTVIEVHNLFYNTPARRKFLKKAATEFGRISEQFSRVALAHPNLHMVLRHNGKLVYELPATLNQRDRIHRFFGSDLGDQLIEVESETTTEDGDNIRVWGYVGEPSLSKATRKDQYLFLNGRFIQDRSLQHALGEAYRGLLMVGRHPVSFLFLEMPPHLVDVNVHPTKTEVRFQDGQNLYRQLLHTLRDRFLALDFQSEMQIPSRRLPTSADSRSASSTALPVQKELEMWSSAATTSTRPPLVAAARQPAAATSISNSADSAAADPKTYPPNLKSSVFRAPVAEAFSEPLNDAQHPSIPSAEAVAQTSPPQPSASQQPAATATQQSATTHATEPHTDSEAPLPQLPPQPSSKVQQPPETVHGSDFRAFQIHDCYLVVADPIGLEIIDQHALHERILYEHVRERILSGQVESQKLLIPQSVECDAGEAAMLLEYKDLLSEIGFEIEDFGGTTILVTAHPVMLPRGHFVRILRDLAAQLEESDGKTSRRDLLDHMLATMACKAAIKAGQRLAPEEMRELLELRHTVDDSHHCPHGRPTSLTLTQATLDKQFGRLG